MQKTARLSGLMMLIVVLLTCVGLTDVSSAATSRVAAGGNHSVALQSDGSLWGWGENGFGQLGDGSLVSRNVPLKIGSDTGWTAVSAGFYHTVALKSDGSLWGWGDNTRGQLGDGASAFSQPVPVRIGTDTSWVEVAAGDFHTLARKSDGSIWGWGDNTSGQVGSGAFVPGIQTVPVRIGTAADWIALAAGGSHSLALKADHTIWSWGANGSGQLGNGSGLDAVAPVKIDLPAPFIGNDWASLAAGRSHSAALKSDGSLWLWGGNTFGQLGDNTNINSHVPVREAGNATSWTAVRAGDTHTVGRRLDGTLWAWGSNSAGQLGNGTNSDVKVPVRAGVDTDWLEAAVGSLHNLAVKTNNTVWGWGDNSFGQVGDGTNIGRISPVLIQLALPPATAVAVTANQPSPHAAGVPVTFTATGSGGNGSYEYRFWLNDGSGSGYVLQRDYSPVNSWIWTPAVGNYDIFVEVRTAGTTVLRDAYTSILFYQVKASIPPASVTMTASVAGPQTPGTPITFIAVAQGGNGPCEYRFYLNSGAGFVLQGPYSTANTFTWTPASTGNYDIFVETRSVGSTSLRDAYTAINFYQILAQVPPSGVTLLSSFPSPQPVGTPITFIANAQGGSGPYEYRFYLNSGAGFTLQGPYSTVNTFTWTPAVAGNYDIFVEVRTVGSTAFREAYNVNYFYQIQ